jgi:hypothetical protein
LRLVGPGEVMSPARQPYRRHLAVVRAVTAAVLAAVVVASVLLAVLLGGRPLPAQHRAMPPAARSTAVAAPHRPLRS